MTDRLTPERRSWNMSRIKSSDTKPERLVRSVLHVRGFRFGLHRKDLPGRPDIVLPKYQAVVFVHGCFWHRHARCPFAYTPKSRKSFWRQKFQANVDRDRRAVRDLQTLGWKVIVVWECETGDTKRLGDRLESELRAAGGNCRI